MAAWLNRLTVAVLLGSFWGAKSAAAAQPLPAGWLESVVNERGQHCVQHDLQADGERLLVACGPAGVWEVTFDASGPRLVRSYEMGGDATGFFVEPDGRIWIKLQVQQARPLDSVATNRPPPTPQPAAPVPAPPSPPAAPPPPAPAAPSKPDGAERRVGRVVSEIPGEVVISLGAADGIARSDRIEFALEHREDWAGSDVAVSKEPLAVGVVVNVAEHHAKVRLGLNEHVPVGAITIPTRAHLTASLSAPPRVADIWELELMARPFAAIGELGGGVLLSGAISRRLAGNWHLSAVVDPFAIADVQVRDSVMAANTALIASYDSQYLEMGLGFGAQTVNETVFDVEPGSGATLAQVIRLGAEDGLNISARTSIVLFYQEFDFGGMVASLQIPVTRGYWLLLGGGGGNVGYAYGELGLRVLMTGNGRAGSTFLTTTAGGAAVFRSGVCTDIDCESSVAYGGPMAGLGGEWRF